MIPYCEDYSDMEYNPILPWNKVMKESRDTIDKLSNRISILEIEVSKLRKIVITQDPDYETYLKLKDKFDKK